MQIVVKLHRRPVYFSYHVNTRSVLSKYFFIRQLMHKWIVLKTILKFTLKWTLKQLRHVSVLQLHRNMSELF